jgi:hypothetical protein
MMLGADLLFIYYLFCGQLIYGSKDAGTTIHRSDPEFNGIMVPSHILANFRRIFP